MPKRDASGFYLIKGPGPGAVWIESDRINDCMEYYKKHGLSHIAISSAMGYALRDIDFLQDYPCIQGVILSSVRNIDISGLAILKKLEYLSISDNVQPLDLSVFPSLKVLRAQWHPQLKLPEGGTLHDVWLHGYRPIAKNLSELVWMANLENLSIIQSPIQSLVGIEKFKSLRRIELSYCTKLVDIGPITGLIDGNLETIECNSCRKIADHSAVKELPRLRVLRFNHCGEIPSLDFINAMPTLEEFRFVGTNISDGNLTPLLRLKRVGFMRKKHYSHTPEEIQQLLGLPHE
ncbi:MAG: hypothetical protein WCJ97_09800 [Phycisphaerae bacterium]